MGHVVAVVGISGGGGGRGGKGGRDVRHRAEELVGCGGEHPGASELNCSSSPPHRHERILGLVLLPLALPPAHDRHFFTESLLLQCPKHTFKCLVLFKCFVVSAGLCAVKCPPFPIQQPLPSFPPFFPPCCCVVLARVVVDGKRGDGRTDGGLSAQHICPVAPVSTLPSTCPPSPHMILPAKNLPPPSPPSFPLTQVGCVSGSNYWGGGGSF